jgi:prephenate dehydratase
MKGAIIKVAIQGELGSFSHEAAERMLPHCAVVPCARSVEVFDRVERGSVAAAVIPIENSLAGTVAEHADLLVACSVFVQGEFSLRIVHNLTAAPEMKFERVRRAFSHPVALDQCRDFFRKHGQIEPVPFYDTAGSVKHVIAQKLPDAAAIAGHHAAREYSGKILQAGIEDDKRNFTRFFLIRKLPGKASSGARNKRAASLPAYQRLIPRGANKTSIAFKVRNVPGALFKSLSVFALRDISLSKIESRPLRGRPWEYVFYADFLRGDDEAARNALNHLREVAEFVKVLGIYPAV